MDRRETTYQILKAFQLLYKSEKSKKNSSKEKYEMLKRSLENGEINQLDFNKYKEIFQEYDNPQSYDIINEIFQNLDLLIKSKRIQTNGTDARIKEIPLWGLLEMQCFSAQIMIPNADSEEIILISEGVPQFAYFLNKVIVQTFSIKENGEEFSFKVDGKQIISNIESNKIIVARFIDLAASYLLENHTNNIRSYLLSDTLINIAMYFSDVFTTFVIAHEYSHHILGHLNNSNVKNLYSMKNIDIKQIYNSWDDELNADINAVVLIISIMQMKGIDKTMTLFGILIVLNSFVLFDMTKNLNMQEQQVIKYSSTHPPAKIRKDTIIDYFVEDDSPQAELLKQMDKVLTYLFDQLNVFLEELKKEYDNILDIPLSTMQDLIYNKFEN